MSGVGQDRDPSSYFSRFTPMYRQEPSAAPSSPPPGESETAPLPGEQPPASKSATIEVKANQLEKIEETRSKKEQGKAAYTAENHKNVLEKQTSIGVMIARRFFPNGLMRGEALNQVTPTSAIHGDAEDAKNLHNIYTLQVNGKTYGVIRSGVINTELRANEFSDVLRKMWAEIKENNPDLQQKKMRVVSHQLNSFEGEKDLINHQHRWLAQAGQNLKKAGIQLAHINTPSNAMYSKTTSKYKWMEKLINMTIFVGISIKPAFKTLKSALRSLGYLVVGKLKPIKVHTATYRSEQASRRQNLDSMGTYLEWIHEGLPKDMKDEFPHFSSQGVSDLLEKCNAKLATATGADRKQLKQDRDFLRAEMKKKLKADYDLLTYLDEKYSIPDTKTKETITLMKMFLGSQLDLPKKRLDRGHELMVIQLLHARLGITSAINCKSGLDRTGFLHAVKMSLEELETEGPSKAVFDLVVNWNSHTDEANLHKGKILSVMKSTGNAEKELEMSHMGEDLIKSLEDGEAGQSNTEFRKMAFGGLPQQAQELAKTTLHLDAQREEVERFRRMVLKNLLEIGLPITVVSTGIPGFKWHAEDVKLWKINLGPILANPIPLNFLPSSIVVDGRVVNILRYAKNGRIEGLTEEGILLLSKGSQYRGT